MGLLTEKGKSWGQPRGTPGGVCATHTHGAPLWACGREDVSGITDLTATTLFSGRTGHGVGDRAAVRLCPATEMGGYAGPGAASSTPLHSP